MFKIISSGVDFFFNFTICRSKGAELRRMRWRERKGGRGGAVEKEREREE
jgi:hypothetical protein